MSVFKTTSPGISSLLRVLKRDRSRSKHMIRKLISMMGQETFKEQSQSRDRIQLAGERQRGHCTATQESWRDYGKSITTTTMTITMALTWLLSGKEGQVIESLNNGMLVSTRRTLTAKKENRRTMKSASADDRD